MLKATSESAISRSLLQTLSTVSRGILRSSMKRRATAVSAPSTAAAGSEPADKKRVKPDPSPHAGPPRPWIPGVSRPASGFPEFLEKLPRRLPGSTVVVACHNVNGIRAAVEKKSLGAWIAAESADLVALQEIKCSPEHLADGGVAAALAGYTVFANCSTAKLGYAGTLLAVRKGAGEALRVCGVGYDLGVPEIDGFGRITTLEFPRFYVACVYAPNSGRPVEGTHPALASRTDSWDPALRNFLNALRLGTGVPAGVRSAPIAGSPGLKQSKLKMGRSAPPAEITDAGAPGEPSSAGVPGPLSGLAKPVLVIGDLNVAYNDLDVWDMKKHRNRTACALDVERDGFGLLLETFRDVWRSANPTTQGFTYFKDTRPDRETTGWRIDYALTAPGGGRELVAEVDIRSTWPAGDHCPLIVRVQPPAT